MSGSARGRFCYDDFTEPECDDLATELQSEWDHYADQTCKERGCEGGGTCSSTVR